MSTLMKNCIVVFTINNEEMSIIVVVLTVNLIAKLRFPKHEKGVRYEHLMTEDKIFSTLQYLKCWDN